MQWGISDKAPPQEKIKAEMNDFLKGLNSVGDIDYIAYSEIHDRSMELLDRMYELGREDDN